MKTFNFSILSHPLSNQSFNYRLGLCLFLCFILYARGNLNAFKTFQNGKILFQRNGIPRAQIIY